MSLGIAVPGVATITAVTRWHCRSVVAFILTPLYENHSEDILSQRRTSTIFGAGSTKSNHW